MRRKKILEEYRKSVLPEYNTDNRLVSIDGFVDKIRELDPKSDDDEVWMEHGNRFEVSVSYPNSLGEMGNQTSFFYKEMPDVEDIRKDLIEEYEFFKEEVNKEVSYGVVAKSGRDEAIERAIDKVCDCSVTSKGKYTCVCDKEHEMRKEAGKIYAHGIHYDKR